MSAFIEQEEQELGRFIKETLDEFHKQEKESRLRYCKEHGKVCIECQIECGARNA